MSERLTPEESAALNDLDDEHAWDTTAAEARFPGFTERGGDVRVLFVEALLADRLERQRLAGLPPVVLARLAKSDDPAVALHLRRHGFDLDPPEYDRG